MSYVQIANSEYTLTNAELRTRFQTWLSQPRVQNALKNAHEESGLQGVLELAKRELGLTLVRCLICDGAGCPYCNGHGAVFRIMES